MQMKPSFYLTVAAAGIVFNVKLGLFECAQVTYQHILQVGDYINYTTWRNLQRFGLFIILEITISQMLSLEQKMREKE